MTSKVITDLELEVAYEILIEGGPMPKGELYRMVVPDGKPKQADCFLLLFDGAGLPLYEDDDGQVGAFVGVE